MRGYIKKMSSEDGDAWHMALYTMEYIIALTVTFTR